MAQIIYTDQPSTGKSIQLFQKGLPADTFVTLAEAKIFSIPRVSSELTPELTDTSRPGEERELVLGEMFINAPLLVSNKTDSVVEVEVIIKKFTGESDFIYLAPKISIPGKEGVRINIQGQTLLIDSPNRANGDRLQIKASMGDALDVFGSATESAAAAHAADTELV